MPDPAIDTAAVARLLTPTRITAWLDCDHSLTLQHRVGVGTRHLDGHGFGAFAQLLADKGRMHEQDGLEHYRAEGRTAYVVPQRGRGESFVDWLAGLDDPLAVDADVFYRLPLAHDGIRGIADFVLRVVDPESGAVNYEPVDAKLARSEAKPGHVLQLCFYALPATVTCCAMCSTPARRPLACPSARSTSSRARKPQRCSSPWPPGLPGVHRTAGRKPGPLGGARAPARSAVLLRQARRAGSARTLPERLMKWVRYDVHSRAARTALA